MANGTRLHRIEPGASPRLAKLDTADISAAPGGKEETRAETESLSARLAELQDVLWARQQERVLLVLQGIDTSGKGGTIQRVFRMVKPTGLRVASFDAPTVDELARDYLWRVHAAVPARGEIGVFDRSHYEDVLAVRVLELVPEVQWRRRYSHINDFERLLVDEGATVVKVFLHISKDEQRERLRARLDNPTKRWKFKVSDLEARARWDDWQDAFEEAIARTSTPYAPWHVIPGDKKWYRDWAVATILVSALERLHLTWPQPEGLDGTVIE